MCWLSSRCFAPLLRLLLLLQGLKGSLAAGQLEVNYLEKCCSLGAGAWANQKLRCESFAASVSGVSAESAQAACLEAADICCRKSFQEQSCQEGKARARAGLSCSGLDDYRRDCCEGCKLGILAGTSGKGCALKTFKLAIPWEPAYTECCLEVFSSITATQGGTSSSSQNSFSSMASYSAEAVTSKKDDLCKLLKGLLCSEMCVPTPGSYYCKCSEGSVLLEDGRTCKSKTSATNAQSIFISKIANSQAVTFNCTLGASTRPRSSRSLPLQDNELNESCPEGFRFSPESSMCEDIDECIEEPTTLCPAGTYCFNSNGSYQCLTSPRILDSENPCELGYRWNFTQRRCLDVDECFENTHKCMTEMEICKNLEGSYVCEIKCEKGFTFNIDYGDCFDVNECAESRNICPQAGSICINTQGSYECRNLEEYRVGGAKDNTRNAGQVSSQVASHAAVQAANQVGNERNERQGDELDYVSLDEEDIDECQVQSQPCAPGEICRNTQGGYDCVPAACPRGFLRVDGACQDVDECAEGVHACTPQERCQNTNGSFTCEQPRTTRSPYASERPGIQCRKGYKVDTRIDSCVDIDECVEGPGCRDHERCQNLQGTYDCSPLCDPGWYFHIPTKTCQDVDECLLGQHSCRQRTQVCRNTNGSYACEPLSACPAGYRRALDGSCVDVDECQEGLHACSRDSYRYCVNLDGSYECITRLPSCPRGYEYSLLTRQCEDVDECRTGRALCNSRFNERCLNLRGSYRCERPPLDLRQQQRRRPACPEGLAYDSALRRCHPASESAGGAGATTGTSSHPSSSQDFATSASRV